MTLKSFSKKVGISIYIYINEVPHKPDICCIDLFLLFFFFSVLHIVQ